MCVCVDRASQSALSVRCKVYHERIALPIGNEKLQIVSSIPSKRDIYFTLSKHFERRICVPYSGPNDCVLYYQQSYSITI